MIIYITGYGRSGSTALSEELERKLNACNLGEVKYLYQRGKDGLLDSYWLNFREENKDIFANPSISLNSFDNCFGFYKWRDRRRYKDIWTKIFNRIGLNPGEEVIIDSSKTTLDSFMRGIYLFHSFDEVYFIQPKRKVGDVIKSLLKGKNSNIERNKRKSIIKRVLHTLSVGIPHLLITKLLTQIYRLYGLEIVKLEDLETNVDNFIRKKRLTKSNSSKELPMIYGNRSRKE
jgi:hypothetical protein